MQIKLKVYKTHSKLRMMSRIKYTYLHIIYKIRKNLPNLTVISTLNLVVYKKSYLHFFTPLLPQAKQQNEKNKLKENLLKSKCTQQCANMKLHALKYEYAVLFLKCKDFQQ